MLQPLLVVPCSYLRAFAHVFSVPLPRKPLTNNCMSSSFFVQRALAICHSSSLFQPCPDFTLNYPSIHPSTSPCIHSPTHPPLHPLIHPISAQGQGRQRMATVWLRAEWRFWRLYNVQENWSSAYPVGRVTLNPP